MTHKCKKTHKFKKKNKIKKNKNFTCAHKLQQKNFQK
jgi:hypothetical protein